MVVWLSNFLNGDVAETVTDYKSDLQMSLCIHANDKLELFFSFNLMKQGWEI
jgi:hypothetical protein